jgi:hypothetical protein
VTELKWFETNVFPLQSKALHLHEFSVPLLIRPLTIQELVGGTFWRGISPSGGCGGTLYAAFFASTSRIFDANTSGVTGFSMINAFSSGLP